MDIRTPDKDDEWLFSIYIVQPLLSCVQKPPRTSFKSANTTHRSSDTCDISSVLSVSHTFYLFSQSIHTSLFFPFSLHPNVYLSPCLQFAYSSQCIFFLSLFFNSRNPFEEGKNPLDVTVTYQKSKYMLSKYDFWGET